MKKSATSKAVKPIGATIAQIDQLFLNKISQSIESGDLCEITRAYHTFSEAVSIRSNVIASERLNNLTLGVKSK